MKSFTFIPKILQWGSLEIIKVILKNEKPVTFTSFGMPAIKNNLMNRFRENVIILRF